MGLINKEDILLLYKDEHYVEKILEEYPVDYSEILAGIVGDLIGDGHLQGNPKWRIDYTSNSIDELKRFEDTIFKIFKIKGKIRTCSTNKFGKTYNYGVNCKSIAIILNSLGVPSYQVRFKIKDKISLFNFYNNISYDNKNKRDRLYSLVRNV